jgi:membrane associated rhomboid family serine protease
MTVLSTYTEWHALCVGGGSGFVAGITGRTEPLTTLAEYALGGRDPVAGHLADIDAEAAYAFSGLIGGYLLGWLLRSDMNRRRQ